MGLASQGTCLLSPAEEAELLRRTQLEVERMRAADAARGPKPVGALVQRALEPGRREPKPCDRAVGQAPPTGRRDEFRIYSLRDFTFADGLRQARAEAFEAGDPTPRRYNAADERLCEVVFSAWAAGLGAQWFARELARHMLCGRSTYFSRKRVLVDEGWILEQQAFKPRTWYEGDDQAEGDEDERDVDQDATILRPGRLMLARLEEYRKSIASAARKAVRAIATAVSRAVDNLCPVGEYPVQNQDGKAKSDKKSGTREAAKPAAQTSFGRILDDFETRVSRRMGWEGG